ncbi:MAG: hypothetical protein WCE30_00550 [Mycobacterium sp.]
MLHVAGIIAGDHDSGRGKYNPRGISRTDHHGTADSSAASHPGTAP